MAINDLFSKRQKRLRGEIPTNLIYDNIPLPFRKQIYLIITETIDKRPPIGIHGIYSDYFYSYINKILCKEYQRLTLDDDTSLSIPGQVLAHFFKTDNCEFVLDFIELAFSYILEVAVANYSSEAINELNERFMEHGIGFQFEGGKIIRVGSTYIHSEIVKPALSLLSVKKFQGACEEYLKAHDNYKHGYNEECIRECSNAFESVLKIICKEKEWIYKETDAAKKLIQICFDNDLIPSFTQNQFTSLQNLLESGVPTIRNKQGGHGQGPQLRKVGDEMTKYALNLTGTNMIFLVELSGIK